MEGAGILDFWMNGFDLQGFVVSALSPMLWQPILKWLDSFVSQFQHGNVKCLLDLFWFSVNKRFEYCEQNNHALSFFIVVIEI